LPQLLDAVVAHADGPHFALPLQGLQRGKGIGHHRRIDRPVHLIEIDIVGAQSFQAGLAMRSQRRRLGIARRHLGGHHGLGAPPQKRSADHLFAMSIVVGLGRIQQVDSRVEGGMDGANRFLFILIAPSPASAEGPASQAQDADHQPGISQVSLFHVPLL